MLKVARHKLAALNLSHITVRQGDLLAAPLESDVAEVVSLHQVLHYLDEPQEAIIEAARLLRPVGTLIIVDYESHDLEDFRTLYNHRRLGFSDTDINEGLSSAGLTLTATETIPTGTAVPDVKIWLGVKPAATPEKKLNHA
jgi:ArsR family transcriptional regulator